MFVLSAFAYDRRASSIGGSIDEVKKEFRTHVIPLLEGDMIYIFTDGYADQFGGEHQKEFMNW